MNYFKKIILSLFTIETFSRAIELYKIKKSFKWNYEYHFPTYADKIQPTNSIWFFRNSVNSNKYGLNSIRSFASKVWQKFSMEMKNLKSLEDFKNKIRRWELDGFDCKLWKDIVSNSGFVNLVWRWDIRLTVMISKFYK